MKVVMYHYVRSDDNRPPYGYYHLDVEDFREQLDFFEDEYRVLDGSTVVDVLEEGRPPPEDGVVLSFDDGLLDHYDVVHPELASRGIQGIFFVPVGQYPYDQLLPVHRIHALIGRYPGRRLLKVLLEVLVDSTIRVPSKTDSRESTAAFKRILTFEVHPHDVTTVLDEVERAVGASPVDPDGYYLSLDELRSLHEAGHIIGAHTVTHPPLARLKPTEQFEELTESRQVLADAIGAPVSWISYPYGDSRSVSERTIEVAESADLTVGFTTESRDLTSEDVTDRPLRLPRRDCNEFPHGGATFTPPES